MNNFNYLWIFLLTCAYFQVNPSQVTAFHPRKEISRVKQIATYMIWRSGATHREAGEVVGISLVTARNHCDLIRWEVERNRELRKDITNLSKLF